MAFNSLKTSRQVSSPGWNLKSEAKALTTAWPSGCTLQDPASGLCLGRPSKLSLAWGLYPSTIRETTPSFRAFGVPPQPSRQCDRCSLESKELSVLGNKYCYIPSESLCDWSANVLPLIPHFNRLKRATPSELATELFPTEPRHRLAYSPSRPRAPGSHSSPSWHLTWRLFGISSLSIIPQRWWDQGRALAQSWGQSDCKPAFLRGYIYQMWIKLYKLLNKTVTVEINSRFKKIIWEEKKYVLGLGLSFVNCRIQ